MIERVTSHGNSGQYGLHLGAAAQVSDCFVDGNGLPILIQTTDQATVTRCSTVGGAAGIQTGPASTVDHVDVRFPTFVGIGTGPGSSITGSTVGGIGAGGWAIGIDGNSRVTDNLIDTGGDKGIYLFGSSSQVARNQIQHVTWGGVYFEVGSSNNIAFANVFRDIAPANVFADTARQISTKPRSQSRVRRTLGRTSRTSGHEQCERAAESMDAPHRALRFGVPPVMKQRRSVRHHGLLDLAEL